MELKVFGNAGVGNGEWWNTENIPFLEFFPRKKTRSNATYSCGEYFGEDWELKFIHSLDMGKNDGQFNDVNVD